MLKYNYPSDQYDLIEDQTNTNKNNQCDNTSLPKMNEGFELLFYLKTYLHNQGELINLINLFGEKKKNQTKNSIQQFSLNQNNPEQ